MASHADENQAVGEMLRRAAAFFGWLFGLLGTVALIGMLPAAILFIIAYMRTEAREPWPVVLCSTVRFVLFA